MVAASGKILLDLPLPTPTTNVNVARGATFRAYGILYLAFDFCSGTLSAGPALTTKQLLDSAIGKVKGNVAGKKAFLEALRSVPFKSVRGEFKFNTNHFPIQDLNMFEVVKDGQGRMTLKTIATPLKMDKDSYADKCKMTM